jgi:hypothetical protein
MDEDDDVVEGCEFNLIIGIYLLRNLLSPEALN